MNRILVLTKRTEVRDFGYQPSELFLYRAGHCRDVVLDEKGIKNY